MTHRWYARPVFFVAEIERAIEFYVARLGFEKAWHDGDGAGSVCQVNHGECEIILSAEAGRDDRSRLFIELTAAAHDELRRDLAKREIPFDEIQWGYETIRLLDPDGNELFFPRPD